MKARIFAIAAAVLLVVASLSWAHWRFGTVSNAVAYLDGRTVQVDQPIQELGTVEPGKRLPVTFNLISLQNEPLRIVGANASCSCILPPEMPMTLEPLSATPLTFNFIAPRTTGHFEQEIELYFDGPIPAIQLKIVGATQ
jgi:hypothetical protein